MLEGEQGSIESFFWFLNPGQRPTRVVKTRFRCSYALTFVVPIDHEAK